MVLSNQPIKRAGIYFFFDAQGIVDDYNIYMLQDIKNSIDELLVVVNGSINEDGRNKFSSVTDQILFRDNVGFDVWAYKEGIEHFGWEALKAFDELVLFNFTNYGPIYPFAEMFDEMAQRDIDFWGITKHHGLNFDPYKKCKYGYIPAHIQSSFITIRSSMLNRAEFTSYWQNMPMINDYSESICYHEAIFTEDFTRHGFACDTYINTDDLSAFADYPLMLYARELVENRRCPIFKRKSFFNLYEEFLDISCGQSSYELYDFIVKKTNYDVNLIWDNLLRTANMYDIKNRMQLNYVIPTDVLKPKAAQTPKVALFMHIYFIDMIELCKKYADNMPFYADIYITTSSQVKKIAIEQAFADFSGRKVLVIQVDNRGREYSGFYIGLKPYYEQYDFICIAHSKKSQYDKPYLIGESFAYRSFENVLASRDFTENVVATFIENPRMGMLVPPPPNHGPYFHLVGREWQGDYEKTKNVARQWGITVDITDTKPPIAPLGNFLWFRSSALKQLFERYFTYEDFPEEPCRDIDGSIMHVIERLYPFIVQQAGYYTGWILSDTFAKMEITNLYKMLFDANQTLFWNFGVHDRHTLLHMVSSTKGTLEILSANQTASSKAKLLVRKYLGNRAFEFLRVNRNKLRRVIKGGGQ